jgi:putative PEP-CTERM system TPR-repeat lipoprotein
MERRFFSRKIAPALGLAAGLVVSAPAWPQSAAELYEQALVAYNDAEIRTAYIHLKNALNEDPNLLSALLLLGKIYLALGNGAGAEEQLMAADRLGAHRSLTLVPLAQSYLVQGKAQQVISELFPLGDSPLTDAELLSLRGQAYLELGNTYDAERSFEQAWERAPDSVPALLGRVQTRLLRGALDDAFANAQRAVDLAPDSARALYLKASIELARGNLETALADYERVVEAEPAHLPAQIGRVGILVELDRIEEAAAAIAEIRDAYPKDPRALYLDAIIASRKGDALAAEQSLQEAENLLAQIPAELIENHAPTLLLAGMVAFSLQNWEQAGDYLDLYHKRSPDAVGPRKLLAQIALKRDQYEGAIALLEPAMQLAPADPGLLSLLAEAYMRDGRHLKASELIERAIAADADDPDLQTQRAINAYALGRPDEAIDRMNSILAERPDQASASASLVLMLVKRHRLDRALEVADDLVRRHPENLTYVNLKGAVQLASGDRQGARESFDAALAIDPRFLPARLNLAKLELADGKAPRAQVRLEALLEEAPNHSGAMLELARAHAAQGQDAEALRWAENVIGADPGSAAAAIFLTDLLLESAEPARAAAVAEAAELRMPDEADLLAAVARAYIASGRRSTAQVVLQRTSSLAGYDARMLLRVAELQRQAGDLEGAVWSLQKAREGEPQFVPARLRLGEALTALGRFEKAELVANELQRELPEEPFGYHLMGTIEQRQGDHAGALKSYTEALKRKGDSPILAVRVFEARRLVDGDSEAVAFLSGWVEEHPDDAIARQALAEGHFRAGRLNEAQALYEQVLVQARDNPILFNNLALVLLRKDDPRALEYARKAHALLPNVPQVADTLGWILVKSGNPSEGLKHLRDAQSRAADDPGISYHIAVALSELGRPKEAIAELRRAVSREADFAEREGAEALLQLLLSGRGG